MPPKSNKITKKELFAPEIMAKLKNISAALSNTEQVVPKSTLLGLCASFAKYNPHFEDIRLEIESTRLIIEKHTELPPKVYTGVADRLKHIIKVIFTKYAETVQAAEVDSIADKQEEDDADLLEDDDDDEYETGSFVASDNSEEELVEQSDEEKGADAHRVLDRKRELKKEKEMKQQVVGRKRLSKQIRIESDEEESELFADVKKKSEKPKLEDMPDITNVDRNLPVQSNFDQTPATKVVENGVPFVDKADELEEESESGSESNEEEEESDEEEEEEESGSDNNENDENDENEDMEDQSQSEDSTTVKKSPKQKKKRKRESSSKSSSQFPQAEARMYKTGEKFMMHNYVYRVEHVGEPATTCLNDKNQAVVDFPHIRYDQLSTVFGHVRGKKLETTGDDFITVLFSDRCKPVFVSLKRAKALMKRMTDEERSNLYERAELDNNLRDTPKDAKHTWIVMNHFREMVAKRKGSLVDAKNSNIVNLHKKKPLQEIANILNNTTAVVPENYLRAFCADLVANKDILKELPEALEKMTITYINSCKPSELITRFKPASNVLITQGNRAKKARIADVSLADQTMRLWFDFNRADPALKQHLEFFVGILPFINKNVKAALAARISK